MLSNQQTILFVLRDKNFNTGHYMQNFLPNFFIRAMLLGTIDFCHFIPLLLTLNLPWFTKSAQSKPIGFIFSHTFHLMRMKFDMAMKQFKLSILRLLRARFIETAVYRLHKKIYVGMYSNMYEWIWFRVGMMIDAIVLKILKFVQLTLTLIQGHRNAK